MRDSLECLGNSFFLNPQMRGYIRQSRPGILFFSEIVPRNKEVTWVTPGQSAKPLHSWILTESVKEFPISSWREERQHRWKIMKTSLLTTVELFILLKQGSSLYTSTKTEQVLKSEGWKDRAHQGHSWLVCARMCERCKVHTFSSLNPQQLPSLEALPRSPKTFCSGYNSFFLTVNKFCRKALRNANKTCYTAFCLQFSGDWAWPVVIWIYWKTVTHAVCKNEAAGKGRQNNGAVQLCDLKNPCCLSHRVLFEIYGNGNCQ